MKLETVKYAYFLGIGGIGMSAIARYFNSIGIEVCGYDKTPSELTSELEKEGIQIHFDENISSIPAKFLTEKEHSLFIYTPAIPSNHKELVYLLQLEITLFKRSEVLGLISRDAFCIAVAGTHGKTTTSTMIAHILHEANVNFVAFLGGISANYNSNYLNKTDGDPLFPDKNIVVLEADEFDRSFHRLNPDIAVITAIDPDHLDIYHSAESFRKAFIEFTHKIKPTGNLVYQYKISENLNSGISNFTYGISEDENVNFRSRFEGIKNGYFTFDFHSTTTEDESITDREVTGITCGLPGFHNIENATAAMGVCLDILNLDRFDVKQGIKSFLGVKRRFEFVVRNENYVVIDDYAHHPQELEAIISSVKELYPLKKITGIFQPHLFTRTRDFAEGFGRSLSMLDELILMEIYPARELPIEGIHSEWLLQKIQTQKQLMDTDSIMKKINSEKPELLLILGAGDIDRLVPKIREAYATF